MSSALARLSVYTTDESAVFAPRHDDNSLLKATIHTGHNNETKDSLPVLKLENAAKSPRQLSIEKSSNSSWSSRARPVLKSPVLLPGSSALGDILL